MSWIFLCVPGGGGCGGDGGSGSDHDDNDDVCIVVVKIILPINYARFTLGCNHDLTKWLH